MSKQERDWHEWHREYDDPTSSLSRRLAVVREVLEATLRDRSGSSRIGLVSLCAGDGRDTLPVLAEADAIVDALLVERDDALCRAARRDAAERGLTSVDVREGDAGTPSTFVDRIPCDVLMLCGVFGNVRDDDVRRTVAAIPALVRPGGVVLWTRGRSSGDHDPTDVSGDPAAWVRDLFLSAGHEEVAYVCPEDAGFRVGAHHVVEGSDALLPQRLFTFA